MRVTWVARSPFRLLGFVGFTLSHRAGYHQFLETHALLSRKRDHNIAEACLIGLYGLRTSRVLVQPASASEEATPQTTNNRGAP